MKQPGSEERLDALREEAAREGVVHGAGVRALGGPAPAQMAGYYGRPVVKPPVWTWEVPLYFFVGGLAGMAAVLAFVSLLFDQSVLLARAALWLAAAGAVVSPILLILDLGRPKLFLNMLRVFKRRSPMSVGVWILVCFGATAVPAMLWMEGMGWLAVRLPSAVLQGVQLLLTGGAALSGLLVAVYTGVLLGATVIPLWNRHRRILPVHFGVVGLGSAAAALELMGFTLPALDALGWIAAGAETILFLSLEWGGDAPVLDRPLHRGRSGLLHRSAGILTGPLALALRIFALPLFAAGSFLVGALVSRFAWVEAGRASGKDPEAAFAAGGSDG